MSRDFVILLTLGILVITCAGPLSANDILAAQGATPTTDIIQEIGVAYGESDGAPLLLDVARPALDAVVRPAVILIHGGAMMFSDRSDLSAHAAALAAAGYVTFNIDYRLLDEAGNNPWPAQLDDAQRAVRWVRANAERYGVDPDRICAFGHSAGGLLAAQLGTRDTRDNSDPSLAGFSSRVACVIELAGEMDMSIPSLIPDGDAITENLLGGTPVEVPDAYRDLSPITHVDGKTAPFLILHGANDELVSVDHARQMAGALHAAGIEVVYAEYPAADHFVWLDWQMSEPLTLAFLQQHLAPDR